MDTPARPRTRGAVDFLAPLGLLVMGAALAWQRLATRPLPGQARWYYLAGAFLVLLHVALEFEAIVAAVGGRQLLHGSISVVLTVAVVAILGGLNWWASLRDVTWDLTKNQRHSLSEPTLRMLAGLRDDIRLVYFGKDQNLREGRDRLRQYTRASSRLKVEFIDPIVNPTAAQGYEINVDPRVRPTLFVERGQRRERVDNDDEQEITNAIIKVTRDAKKTVCFAEGEGERDPDDTSPRGYAGAKALLAGSQYETKKVGLLREGRVPASCTVLVVAGPEKDLLPPAVDAIRHFVKTGGKALLLLEPEVRGGAPSLSALAAEWNVQVGKDVVVDRSGAGAAVGGGALTPVVEEYPYHDITRNLRGTMTVFHIARSVQAGTAPAPGVSAQNLAETLKDYSWAETNLSPSVPARYDAGADKPGPVSLGAVVTLSGAALEAPGAAASPAPVASALPGLDQQGMALPEVAPSASAPAPAATASPAPSTAPAASPAPDASPTPDAGTREARVVVFGDSDFATNTLLAVQANQDLFLNTVAWLAQDPDLISIHAREPDDQRLLLTDQQKGNAFLFAHVLIPGLVLALGVVSWWQRRG